MCDWRAGKSASDAYSGARSMALGEATFAEDRLEGPTFGVFDAWHTRVLVLRYLGDNVAEAMKRREAPGSETG